MTVLKYVLLVVAFLLIIMIFVLYISGFFTSIRVQEKVTGPYVLVYKDHLGDYKETRTIQDDIYYALLNDYDLETYKGFGIYYDDPKEVPKENLRSKAGCILEESQYSHLNTLEKSFNIYETPKQDSILVEFPLKNKFSPLMGLIKVYPAIKKYTEQNNLSEKEILEVYDIPNKKITYIMAK